MGGRDADAVSGDLRETFEERGGGRLWYWRQAASCVAVRLSPGRRMLPGLGADFHYALRLIRRNPGYALTAMLCLALAMGVNTTSSAAAPQDVGTNVVEPNYFEMMRVPILKGRGFARTGALTDAPAVVVNETMARTWWPGEDPLGKTLWLAARERRGKSAR